MRHIQDGKYVIKREEETGRKRSKLGSEEEGIGQMLMLEDENNRTRSHAAREAR